MGDDDVVDVQEERRVVVRVDLVREPDVDERLVRFQVHGVPLGTRPEDVHGEAFAELALAPLVVDAFQFLVLVTE